MIVRSTRIKCDGCMSVSVPTDHPDGTVPAGWTTITGEIYHAAVKYVHERKVGFTKHYCADCMDKIFLPMAVDLSAIMKKGESK